MRRWWSLCKGTSAIQPKRAGHIRPQTLTITEPQSVKMRDARGLFDRRGGTLLFVSAGVRVLGHQHFRRIRCFTIACSRGRSSTVRCSFCWLEDQTSLLLQIGNLKLPTRCFRQTLDATAGRRASSVQVAVKYWQYCLQASMSSSMLVILSHTF